jgi:putative hydrolase of the HAD superfamily
MDAVVFDLWETLVDYPAGPAKELERRWAERLGVGAEEFHARWLAGRRERDVGTLADSFRAIGVGEDLIDEFVEMRHAFTRRMLVPRPGAIETLRELRARGFKLGLITVCSEEVSALWPDTPVDGLFDSAVFSAACGLRKPDAEIYLLACRELGVEPPSALFVGDGANDELAGAMRVGMRAVLVERHGNGHPWPEVRDWTGARIVELPEVLELV